MYVESISRLTASEESGPFMRLRPENVNEVFQSLVKMGDVAHALRDDSIPMPTITLTAHALVGGASLRARELAQLKAQPHTHSQYRRAESTHQDLQRQAAKSDSSAAQCNSTA